MSSNLTLFHSYIQPALDSPYQSAVFFVQRWEELTPLTEGQLDRLAQISRLVAERPIPKEVRIVSIFGFVSFLIENSF